MGYNHQVCSVHEIRHYRKLEALTETHRVLKEQMLTLLYDIYKKLKNFKLGLTTKLKIQEDFKFITEIKTGFVKLGALIEKTKARENGLLTVLRYPFVPLLNNLCEQDLRENVIKRKVFGGTKTKLGTLFLGHVAESSYLQKNEDQFLQVPDGSLQQGPPDLRRD